jgi:hypothetical protein
MFDRLHGARWRETRADACLLMHPFERRAALARTFRRHLYLTIVLFVVALAASLLARRSVGPLIVGAALATCLFALVAVIASAAARQEAIDAIARGDERIIARRAPAQLSGLTSRRNRRALANTLALCLQPPPRLRNDILSTARIRCRQNPSLSTQLTEVIRRLQHDQSAAMGVALVHQLITDVGSPLYSGTTEELRRSLARISYLLAIDDSIIERQAAPARQRSLRDG